MLNKPIFIRLFFDIFNMKNSLNEGFQIFIYLMNERIPRLQDYQRISYQQDYKTIIASSAQRYRLAGKPEIVWLPRL